MAKIHFPKGEGIKIIKSGSEAIVPDTIYIRAVDGVFAEMIVLSKSGKKRKIGGGGGSSSSKIIIGAVSFTTTSIRMEVHSGGKNSVQIEGINISKEVPDEWIFPEVTTPMLFTIYALDDPQIFFLAKDGEEIPAGALLVRSFLISPEYSVDLSPYALQSALEQESSYRQSADDALGELIQDEAQTRYGADVTLQNNINNEASTRQNADVTLQQNINNEASTRANADDNLRDDIEAEQEARIEADLTKLDKPTSNGNWVVTKINNIYTYTNADDFGKNIANSPLQTTELGSLNQNHNFNWTYGDNTLVLGYSQTTDHPEYSGLVMNKQNITWSVTKASLNYSSGVLIAQSQVHLSVNQTRIILENGFIRFQNAQFQYQSLPDKSTDSTYDMLVGINNTGVIAKTNGKTLIKNMPSILTDEEKQIWRTEMNGGYSTGTMSVAFISPPIAKNDGISYLTLVGANLNFNPSNFSVKLINVATNVITTIPNNQVILTSSTELTLWYDFTNIPLGTYKIILNNGVAQYTTTTTVDIVINLSPIDMSLNTWDVTTYNGNINPTIQKSNTSFGVQASANVIPPDYDGKVLVTATSKSLGNMSEDFYIKIGLWNTGNTGSIWSNFGGLSNDVTPVNLQNIISGGRCRDNGSFSSLSGGDLGSTQSANNTIILYKKGSFLTTIVKGSYGVHVLTTTVSTDANAPIKIKMAYNNIANIDNIANIIIHSAYKI